MKYSRKVDDNQSGIVSDLRKISGVSVQLDVNDILVGYKGRNYWYEVKATSKSEVKKGQAKLAGSWHGHYMFAFCTEDILEDIGIKPRTPGRSIFTAVWHALIREGKTPAKASKWASIAREKHACGDFDSPQQLIVDAIEEGKE